MSAIEQHAVPRTMSDAEKGVMLAVMAHLVWGGMAVYFGLAVSIGAVGRDDLKRLLLRRRQRHGHGRITPWDPIALSRRPCREALARPPQTFTEACGPRSGSFLLALVHASQLASHGARAPWRSVEQGVIITPWQEDRKTTAESFFRKRRRKENNQSFM